MAGTILGAGLLRSSERSLDERVYVLLQAGQYRAADKLITSEYDESQAPSEVWVQAAARAALESQNWNLAMALAEPGGTAAHVVWYARGLGAARAARPDGNRAAMAIAQTAAARLDVFAAAAGRESPVEMERVSVLAAIAAAQEERDELAVLLIHLSGLAGTHSSAGGLPVPLIPVHELAGDLWLQVDRLRDARREYERALERHPERPRSIFGLAEAARLSGDLNASTTAYRRLLAAWKDADEDRFELALARRYGR